MSQLKPVSGARSTTADVLEGVPSGSVLKNQIDGWRNAMQSLQNSAMEEGDPGGILKSSEDAVRKGGETQDAIMHR